MFTIGQTTLQNMWQCMLLNDKSVNRPPPWQTWKMWRVGNMVKSEAFSSNNQAWEDGDISKCGRNKN